MAEMILIIDDDPVQRRLMEAALTRLGHKVQMTESGEEGLKVLQADKAGSIGLVMLDLMMPGMNGHDVQRAMAEQKLDQPVIVQTAQGSIETAILAMREGAFDFLVKPPSPERLKLAVGNALKWRNQSQKGSGEKAISAHAVDRAENTVFTSGDIVVRSPAMQQVMNLARKAAASTIPVMIEGESGVGKEIVAQVICKMGGRAKASFVPVNCGAIPEKLVESVLFGHEKGAFTGATERHKGKFSDADGGTLFLDEIGDLPLDAQVKLLRAVQSGEIDPVGAKTAKHVDVRLITATNRDLSEMVAQQSFRDDLYYRLNIFPIRVPPLRERVEDIAPLAHFFAQKYAAKAGRSKAPQFSSEALNILTAFDWPGNIRELENAVFRALVLSDADILEAHDFPHILVQVNPKAALSEPNVADSGEGLALSQNLNLMPDEADIESLALVMQTHIARDGAVALFGSDGHIYQMAKLEADIIKAALHHYGGRMSAVAKHLGIGRSTLYRKVSELGLDAEMEIAKQ